MRLRRGAGWCTGGQDRSGSILIDGVDIAKMGLAQLRSSLSIIPQVSGHGTRMLVSKWILAKQGAANVPLSMC